jgi:hypothetical protein
MLRASALSLTCAVLALAAAGCGESGSAGEGDPASLVPAGASIYLEATVQPQGDRREDALAAAGKIMRTDDPAGKLRDLVDKELAEEGDGLTWERDFAPWLGEDAGVWATNLQAPEPSFAAIVATKDADAAKTALAKFEKTSDSGPYTARSYDGIDYKVDAEGVAQGVVADFVVIGSEDAFKRSADTRDADSLLDDDRYGDAIGELEEERLGHYYVDVKPLLDAALKQDREAAQSLEQFKSLLPLDKLGPITGAFTADADGMTLDTAVTGVPDGPLRDLARLWSGGGTELLGELPGDAWGAFATPKLGEAAQSLFSAFAGAIGGGIVAAQVEQATGLDLQQDVFSWIGDVGLFVRGADMASLDGALVIGSTDDKRAEAAFGKIVGLVGKESGAAPKPTRVDGADAAFALAAPGAKKPVILARGNGRVVAAYGEQAASAALSPDAKLGDSEDFGAAEEMLGDGMEPSFLLSIADVIRLADALGETDARFDKARPYLETLGVVTTGGKADGDRIESRVAVTLK